jgi:hypothetical protein
MKKSIVFATGGKIETHENMGVHMHLLLGYVIGKE